MSSRVPRSDTTVGTVTPSAFVRGPTRDPAWASSTRSFFRRGPTCCGCAASRRHRETVTSADAKPGPVARISEGVIVTGDSLISSSVRRDELRGELKASVVEMEGAAVAQVCARSAFR